MSYDSTKLRMIAQSGFDSGGVWIYASPDPHGTCEGAGYFANGGKVGMKIGDLLFVIEASGGGATCHSVTALAAAPQGPWDPTPGAATISAGQFS